jgi:hypothetical protein
MKKPFPPKKATGTKVFEYGGLEKYASKSKMMKHEKGEPKSKEMAEGKSYKVGSKPMTTSRDSMSSRNAMDPKKKPDSTMSKPPKESFSFGKPIKKATSAVKKAVKGPNSTMSKPPKESFSLGKTIKKATSAVKKAVKGPRKTGLNRYM